MTSVLQKIGSAVARHALATLLAWVLLLALSLAAFLNFSQGTQGTYSIPGASYEAVRQSLYQKIPEHGVSNGVVVLEAAEGFDNQDKEAIGQAIQEASELDAIASVLDPFLAADMIIQSAVNLEAAQTQLAESRTQLAESQASYDQARAQIPAGLTAAEVASQYPDLAAQERALTESRAALRALENQVTTAQRENASAADANVLSSDGTTALVNITFDQDASSLSLEQRQALYSVFDQLKDRGLEVNYSYEIAQDPSGLVGVSETLGILVAFLVLLVTLGSVLAAGLPLILALLGAGIAVALVYASTLIIDMTPTDPVLALMLGLGVGIDYALLILYRFRQELLAGADTHQALVTANSTAGHSVVFAGLTNIIALASLSVTQLPFLTVMGLAGSFSVALVVLSSITLVPAVLSLLGTRLLTSAQKKELALLTAQAPETNKPENRRQALAEQEENYSSWGRFVTRQPILMTLLTTLLLVLAIIPTNTLRLGLPDGSTQDPQSTAYQAYQTISEKFGEGVNGPIYAEVTISVPGDDAHMRYVALNVADHLKTNRIESVAIVASSQDKATAVLAFFPAEGPSAQSTLNTVNTMLANEQTIEKATATHIGLTGQTVANIEISQKISDSVPLYLTLVIILCLLLMALVFRSVLIPIMATIGFLLSTLASFGLVVAVYQWGWLGDFFGVTEPGPILAFLPILLIGILFGLSVDYQIFIVAGMRDAYRSGTSAHEAVLVGYKQGARVVTACGIIMVAVFTGFIFSHYTAVRPIGFALALAVALDAFLIRTTFIPATMSLLGEAAWWWPFGSQKKAEGKRSPRHIAH
ncbi:MAG: MMPL family transporter [Rothia sp. (in: high G+C Gram-positive bacteria)]|nr:MMPL family transporter [Rothia sp. (in: high G+C Gram-positive bacteria)]